MSKIIVVLGDSLAMSRDEYNIYYKNTYPYLLHEKLDCKFHVINKSKRGNTTTQQSSIQYLYDEIETINGDIFIIHLGICDCAPRLFNKYENLFLNINKFNFLNKLYINFKSKYRRFFTKYFPIVNVKIDQFRTNLIKLTETILKTNSNSKIIFINIAETNQSNKSRSYFFEKNITSYNNVIYEIKEMFSNKIEILDFNYYTKINSKLILEDGIHLSNDAHLQIANELFYFFK